MKKPKKKTEAEKDKRIHEDLIKLLKSKGLVLIKGIWQKPIKKQ